MAFIESDASREEVQGFLEKPDLRLTVEQATALAREQRELRGDRWLTYLVLRAVERSGYDRGHAVATREAAATEGSEACQ